MIANKADAMVVVNEQAQRIADLEHQLAEAETAHAETIGEIFRNEVVPLKDRIAELERELAEARKDSERLEFLFGNRQAIDNAIQEGQNA